MQNHIHEQEPKTTPNQITKVLHVMKHSTC